MNVATIPSNIDKNEKEVFELLTKEGYNVEITLVNDYPLYAIRVKAEFKKRLECRFPLVKFVGVQ